jgi:hypothetical protein
MVEQAFHPILDGAVRDGRHHMQIRVYYEDTDFSGTSVSEYESPCAAMTSFVVRRGSNRCVHRDGNNGMACLMVRGASQPVGWHGLISGDRWPDHQA